MFDTFIAISPGIWEKNGLPLTMWNRTPESNTWLHKCFSMDLKYTYLVTEMNPPRKIVGEVSPQL